MAEEEEQPINQRTSERIRRELGIPVASRPTERALKLYLDVQNRKEIDQDALRLPTAELEAAGNLLLDYGGHKAVDSEHARDQIDAVFSFVEGPLAAALIRARSAESEAASIEAVFGPFGEGFQPLVDAENVRRENRRVLREAPLNYVDFFSQATYDVSFRPAEPGRSSTKIQLVYPDGTELVVDLGEIKNETLSVDELRDAIANGEDGRSGRFFPDAGMNRSTTPRLVEAAEKARVAMADSDLTLQLEFFPHMWILLTSKVGVSAMPRTQTFSPRRSLARTLVGPPPSSGVVEPTTARPAEDAGGALVRVPVRDGVLMVDNNIASSLSIKLTPGESALQEGAQTLAVRATERLGKPIVLTPTGSRELLRDQPSRANSTYQHRCEGSGAIEKAPPVFPVAEIAPTSTQDFAGLAQTVKTLREAGVGGSAPRGVRDRAIVAEAMVAGKQAGVVPEFLTTDRSSNQGPIDYRQQE